MDTVTMSLLWGRLGAAILCILSFILSTFGIDFSLSDQDHMDTTIAGILAGASAIMSCVSKWREQARAKEALTAKEDQTSEE